MNDYSKNTQISIEELKKLQLFIMDEIDAFCRENNIDYFITGGTLLGAIRHKGYIPWDDDIDIGLMREHYEKLITTFKSPSGLVQMLTHKNCDTYIYPFAKAIRNDTVFIETDEKHAIGVNIDIFPIEKMPTSEYERRKIFKKVKMFRRILMLKYMNYNRERSLVKNIIVVVGKNILRVVSDKYLLNKLDDIFNSCNIYSSEFCANLCGAWGERELLYISDIVTLIESQFEGRNYFLPKGYDRCLTGLYGDYMKLPPEEKRKSHHTFTAYYK